MRTEQTQYMAEPGTSPEIQRPRIAGALFPEVQNFYNDVLSASQQTVLEKGFHKVLRMGEVVEKEDIPIQNRESDLEHIIAACEMTRDLHTRFPVLRGPLSFSRIQRLLLVHDLGELVVGDMPTRHKTPEQQGMKDREPTEGRRVINRIKDPNARAEVRTLYDSYISNDQNDVDVQMARLIDKMQGLRGIASRTAPLLDDKEVKRKMREHLIETIPGAMEPVLRLTVLLPEQNQREAIEQIANEELARVEEAGHSEAVAEFRKRDAA